MPGRPNARAKRTSQTPLRHPPTASSLRAAGPASCKSSTLATSTRAWRTRAPPRLLFTPSKPTSTGADSATVWDLTAGDQIARMDGHTDYVRAAACASVRCGLPGLTTTVAESGTRRQTPRAAAPGRWAWRSFRGMSLQCYGGGAGRACVWDVVGGDAGFCYSVDECKTVTAVSVVDVTDIEGGVEQPRLLSGTLDGHVKVCIWARSGDTRSSIRTRVLAVAVARPREHDTMSMADELITWRAETSTPLSPQLRVHQLNSFVMLVFALVWCCRTSHVTPACAPQAYKWCCCR
jgi:WD40 repeat protein